MGDQNITIAEVDPRQPEILAMIEELDRLMLELYPVENNYLVSPEDLATDGSFFFAAYLEGKACGCAALMLRDPDYAEVKRVFVAPQARGFGLARRLLAELETRARALKCDFLRLETGEFQPDALALFQSAGYATCGAFGDYPEGAPHSVFMEKRLPRGI